MANPLPLGGPYGKRLVLNIIEEKAKTIPDENFCSIPRTEALEDGFFNITWATLKKATDFLSWWLDDNLGTSHNFDVIAYLGPRDPRYYILISAVMKTKRCVLFPSPRNSLEAQHNLFQKTKTQTLLTGGPVAVQPLLAGRSMNHFEIPSLEVCLSAENVKDYPFKGTYDSAGNDLVCILHTSGTTGLPKPIPIYQKSFCALDALNIQLPNEPPFLITAITGVSGISAMPPFHYAGIAMGFLMPAFYNTSVIWPPVNAIPNAELVERMLDVVEVDCLLSPPSVIEDITKTATSLEKIRKVKFFLFGGGPLSEEAGNKLVDSSTLINVVASTETGMHPLLIKENADWVYCRFPKSLDSVELRPTGDDTFELVYHRDAQVQAISSTFITFPDETIYETKELYVKHPTKSGLYKYHGRKDDVIVLSNGEKFTPIDMEETVRQSIHVAEVLIIGEGREEVIAIIEPKNYDWLKEVGPAAAVEAIWPRVVAANKSAPAHAQLQQSCIVFADQDRPFPRSGKGTVQRRAAARLYDDIDKKLPELASSRNSGPPLTVSSSSHLSSDLVALFSEMLQRNIATTEDFFRAGLDSLQVIIVVKKLKLAVNAANSAHSSDDISPRLIYSNPTIESLSSAVEKLLNGSASDVTNSMATKRAMLAEFGGQLVVKGRSTESLKNSVVLITGTTGSLGSYILATVATSPNVSKVYCLNRGPDSESKQARVNSERGLGNDFKKVVFLEADLSHDNIGLDKSVYADLLQEVTAVIHNQWQVDFNLSLDSFRPHIAGTKHLLELCADAAKRPFFLFVSSISTTINWAKKHSSNELVPEKFIDDLDLSSMGYGDSKLIAERIISESGIPSAICRVGQIAGPIEKFEGKWNSQEWFPTLLFSSKYMQLVPNSIPSFDDIRWLPVDKLAKIIAELVNSGIEKGSNTDETSFYNLVNPNPTEWTSLIPSVSAGLGLSDSQVVNYNQWVSTLRASAKGRENDIERNPGIKLLDFYESLTKVSADRVGFETTAAARDSSEFSALLPVQTSWMKLWLAQLGLQMHETPDTKTVY